MSNYKAGPGRPTGVTTKGSVADRLKIMRPGDLDVVTIDLFDSSLEAGEALTKAHQSIGATFKRSPHLKRMKFRVRQIKTVVGGLVYAGLLIERTE